MQSPLLNEEQYVVHFQRYRELFIKVSLLNSQNIKVDEVEGLVVSGSINIKNSGSVRRSCNISMIVKDNTYLFEEGKRMWFNQRIKIEIGIKSVRTDEVIWFNKGHYIINQPNLKYNSSSKMLDFEGLDYMCQLDGTLGGILPSKILINKDIDISTAIQTTATSLGKITNLNIERINKVIPDDIEKEAGENVYSVLDTLAKLYMNWELYFDEDGILRFNEIKNRDADMTLLNFEEDENNLITSYDVKYDLQNVRNKVIVWGYTNNEGVQVHTEISNTQNNSPFDINKIGVIPMVVKEDKIFNQEQADARANYELFLHNNMNDKVSISCVPFYFLDVNKLVEFDISEIELYGKFLIDEISIPLGLGEMTFSAHKIYI